MYQETIQTILTAVGKQEQKQHKEYSDNAGNKARIKPSIPDDPAGL